MTVGTFLNEFIAVVTLVMLVTIAFSRDPATVLHAYFALLIIQMIFRIVYGGRVIIVRGGTDSKE